MVFRLWERLLSDGRERAGGVAVSWFFLSASPYSSFIFSHFFDFHGFVIFSSCGFCGVGLDTASPNGGSVGRGGEAGEADLRQSGNE